MFFSKIVFTKLSGKFIKYCRNDTKFLKSGIEVSFKIQTQSPKVTLQERKVRLLQNFEK